jgi:hypothetical protein
MNMRPLDGLVMFGLVVGILFLGFEIGQHVTCVNVPFLGTGCAISTH